MSQTSVPSITLNNGVRLPALGFGVFQSPPDETSAAVETALRAATATSILPQHTSMNDKLAAFIGQASRAASTMTTRISRGLSARCERSESA